MCQKFFLAQDYPNFPRNKREDRENFTHQFLHLLWYLPSGEPIRDPLGTAPQKVAPRHTSKPIGSEEGNE
jgi:hypothetical protein